VSSALLSTMGGTIPHLFTLPLLPFLLLDVVLSQTLQISTPALGSPTPSAYHISQKYKARVAVHEILRGSDVLGQLYQNVSFNSNVATAMPRQYQMQQPSLHQPSLRTLPPTFT